MSFSGGVFSRLYNFVNDRDAGIKVVASRMDAEMDGIATGLSTAILKDGTQIVTANIPMATYKFTGLGAGTAAGESVRYEQVVLLSAGANQTISRSATGTVLTLESTEAGAARAPDLVLYRNSATPADADVGPGILFDGEDSGGTQTTFGLIHAVFDDITDTTEDGSLHFSVITAGTLADELVLTGANLYPNANDGLALGLSGNGFSDAFFASGAVFNFNAGNYTITHSAGNLAFSGAITLGTDLAVAEGGTGASTAANARINLEAQNAKTASFVANKTSDQVMSTTGALTTLSWTEVTDQGALFASNAWVPPAGRVEMQVDATVFGDASANVYIGIFKNLTTLVAGGYATSSDANAFVMTIHGIDTANGTDSYTARYYSSNAGFTMVGDEGFTGSTYASSWFSGKMIGGT